MQVFPRFERSQLVPRLALGLAIAVVVAVGSYMLFLHSEPYEFGTHFVSTDPRVTEVTGVPQSTDLRVLRGFRFSFGDRSGNAAMTIRAHTERGTFDVELNLEKRAGRWLVERAHVYPPSGTAITVVNTGCTSSCS